MKYKTILADPPWQYQNRTGKASPEHSRLHRYKTMSVRELEQMKPFIDKISDGQCHLYMWCTWPMIHEGLSLMEHWGFEYKTGIPWLKVAQNGEPDRRCMGFYGRVVTEILLFGVKNNQKKAYRTKAPHNKANVIIAAKQDHSRKPESQYEHIESQSEAPYIELFARSRRYCWDSWGDQIDSIERDL